MYGLFWGGGGAFGAAATPKMKAYTQGWEEFCAFAHLNAYHRTLPRAAAR